MLDYYIIIYYLLHFVKNIFIMLFIIMLVL